MTSGWVMWPYAVVLFLLSCGGTPPGKPATPEGEANAFLREVHAGNCKHAFTFFSQASRDRIEAESAAVIAGAPYYAEEFKPENLYCKPTYAHRYLNCVVGSAKLEKIETMTAVVTADQKEGTDFLVPGFWPTQYTVTPVEIHMVQENGAWKIDLGDAPDQQVPDEEQKPDDEEE